MSLNFHRQSGPSNKMSETEFAQVVGAITEGRYSWACVLILQSAGYNPLHYIPYRTYNRLMKDHQLMMREQAGQATFRNSEPEDLSNSEKEAHISDLHHARLVDDSSHIRGRGLGFIFRDFT